ncbi:MAG: hypothetical protein V1895_00810 [Parcubacteria group bacterium]
MPKEIDLVGIVEAYHWGKHGGFQVYLFKADHSLLKGCKGSICLQNKQELRGFLSGLGQMIHQDKNVFFVAECRPNEVVTFYNRVQFAGYLGPGWVKRVLRKSAHLRNWLSE